MMAKGFKWFVLIGAFMTVLTTCGLLQSIGLFVVEWQEEFDVSAEEIGWIGSCFIIGFAIAGLLVAILGSLVSCRGVTMFGGAMACAGLSLAHLTSAPWHLYLVMMITGFGLGCSLTGSLTVIGFYFRTNEGVVNGIIWAGGSFGLFVLPPLLRHLIEVYSWRGAMLVSAGLTANVCVYGVLFRSTKWERLSTRTKPLAASSDGIEIQCEKEITNSQSLLEVRVYLSQDYSINKIQSCTSALCSSSAETSSNGHLGQMYTNSLCTISSRLRRRVRRWQQYPIVSLCMNSRILLHYFCQGLRGFGNFAVMVYFVSLAVDNNISKNRATFLLSLMGVSGTTVRLTHGIILDKKLITPIHLQSVSLVIGGGSCILITISQSFLTFTAFALIFGSCNGIFNVLSPVILRQIVEAREIQAANGLSLSAVCFGSVIGVPIGGALFDATKDYAASYYASGSVLIAGGLFHLADHLLVSHQRRSRRMLSSSSNEDVSEL